MDPKIVGGQHHYPSPTCRCDIGWKPTSIISTTILFLEKTVELENKMNVDGHSWMSYAHLFDAKFNLFGEPFDIDPIDQLILFISI